MHAESDRRSSSVLGAAALKLEDALSIIGFVPLAITLAAVAEVCGTPPDDAPDSLRFAQYFLSKPQDAAGMRHAGIKWGLVSQSSNSNPALNCPDMFAWKLSVESQQRGLV